MIEPVTERNIREWSALCLRFWPDTVEAELLVAFHAGELPYEFLYWQRGKAVAFLSLSRGENGAGVVESLYVLPEYRGQGIGGALLRHAVAWAETQGILQLVSVCEAADTKGCALRRRMGFRATGMQDSFLLEVPAKISKEK